MDRCEQCGSEIKLRATPLGEKLSCQRWCSLGAEEAKECEVLTKKETARQQAEVKAKLAAERR